MRAMAVTEISRPLPLTADERSTGAGRRTLRRPGSGLFEAPLAASHPRVRAALRRDLRTAAYAAGATMVAVFLVDALTLGDPAPGQLLPNAIGSIVILVALLILRGPGRRWPQPIAFAIGMTGVGAAVAPIFGFESVRYLMLAYYALLMISMAVFMPWDGRWHAVWVGAAFGCLALVAVSPAAAGGPFAEQLMTIGLAAAAASLVGHAVLYRRRLRSFAIELQLRSLHQRLRADQLELRRLNTELLAVSRADPLTRVGNRLRFEEDMRLLLSRTSTGGGTGVLALLDVDNFKLYNDTFGHLAGDSVLRAIAEAIGRALPGGGGIYRFGGEEFLVLLPSLDADAGIRALDRIRDAVAAMAIPHPRNASWGVVTISVGMALIDPETAPDDWLRSADAALYEAKASGRNATRSAAA
jgi:diguanylate cyclase (GGDEF)-like protein